VLQAPAGRGSLHPWGRPAQELPSPLSALRLLPPGAHIALEVRPCLWVLLPCWHYSDASLVETIFGMFQILLQV
jgi:hypothetical protein